MNNNTLLYIENHIILDQYLSWPKNIIEIIEDNKEDLNGYLNELRRIDKLAEDNVEYRIIRPENKHKLRWDIISNSIKHEIINKKIVGFHCTRLLDFEISDILKDGLQSLSQENSISRINKLYYKGLISKALRDKLIIKKEIRLGNRIGRTFFFHYVSTLQDETGLYRFFKSWGGEAIYLNFEFNTKLQEIGVPCIVIASINIKDIADLQNLANKMICIYLKDQYLSHDFITWLNNKNRTIVLKIIERSNEYFNSLTRIEEWNTIIK